MSVKELRNLVAEGESGGVQSRLRSGIVFRAAAMSDGDTEDPVDPQILELRHKLTMAEEQLEVIKNEADEKLRLATQAAEQVLKEVEEARQKAEQLALRNWSKS